MGHRKTRVHERQQMIRLLQHAAHVHRQLAEARPHPLLQHLQYVSAHTGAQDSELHAAVVRRVKQVV